MLRTVATAAAVAIVAVTVAIAVAALSATEMTPIPGTINYKTLYTKEFIFSLHYHGAGLLVSALSLYCHQCQALCLKFGVCIVCILEKDE